MMMARAFVVAALLALAVSPCVRAQGDDDDGPMQIPMNAKGKYAKAEKPEGTAACHQIYGCVECEYQDKAVGSKHKSEGSFLQCLACDMAQGYVLNTFTGRCDCAPGFGAPLASGQLTSLWKYVPGYVDESWTQGGNEEGVTKPILLPDFVWPAKYRQCTMCPAGTFTDGASAIRTRCTFCPRGKTTSGAGCGDGSSCCDQCAPGWTWSGTACVPCALGTYGPGGPASGTAVTCTPCDGNEDTGTAGFTLAAGAASEKQCQVFPTCPDATTDATCPDSNYIIRKGFHIPQEDGTGVPTTQHYNKKVGDGVEGYYCVACTPGTTTSNCRTGGGTCVVDTGDLPTPSPEYKKLKDTHFKKIGSYHARGDVNDDDGDMPGVEPVAGYEKVKYSFKGGNTIEDGGHEGDAGDDDGHDAGGKGKGGKKN